MELIYRSIMREATTAGIEPVFSNENKRVWESRYRYGSDESMSDTVNRVARLFIKE